MSAKVYVHYLDAAVAGDAKDNVASGRWPGGCTLAVSGGFLPCAPAWPGNAKQLPVRNQSDRDRSDGRFHLLWRRGNPRAALRVRLDDEVKPEFRRQGDAKASFDALEPLVRELGLTRIGLHVFGHNPGARALYRKLGYSVTSVNMRRHPDNEAGHYA